MKKQPTRVGIMVGEMGDFNRRIVQGVARYVQEGGVHWAAFPSNPSDSAFLTIWKPHGIIATLTDQTVADQIQEMVRKLDIPLVIVRPRQMFLPDAPHVLLNDHKIGRMAAEHLWEIGYRQLATCTMMGRIWSDDRAKAFAEFAMEHKVACFQYQTPATPGYRIANEPGLQQWLAHLPNPVGIFVNSDYLGFELTDICHQLRLQVPDDVGLVGVENDLHWCMLASPRLSSIDPGGEQAGYEAAQMLHKMLKGRKPPSNPIIIEPLRLVVRQSSDIVLAPDPVVAEALRFIREHATEPLNVKLLAANLSVSRSSLERRFKQHVGRTPFREIRTARIARVRQLLVDTRLTPRQITAQCGFRNVSRMSEMFRKEMKISPGRYRASFHRLQENESEEIDEKA